MRISHAAILVEDQDNAKHFYTEILGSGWKRTLRTARAPNGG